MKITKRALERICGIRRGRSLPEKTGVRLGLVEGVVFLKWDGSGPNEGDFVVARNGVEIFIDAELYLRLAEYTLDFAAESARPGFTFSLVEGKVENGGQGKAKN
jgi:Fe-S cluster assembly iron-binding protein IscA